MLPKLNLKGSDFNPAAFGGENADGTIRPGSGPVFNDKGEINAYDKRDALMQVRAIVDAMIGGQTLPTFQRHAKTLTAEQRREYVETVKEALQTPEGMALVGQELQNPIREVLDYEGFSRKVFAPREVGPGEIPRYDRDLYPVAWVVGYDGITPESMPVGRYFYPPEWSVTANIMLHIQDIYQMQYDAIARAQDRAKQAVQYQEDRSGVNLLDTASTVVNDVVYTSTFDWSALIELKWQIEKNRIPCSKFLINLSETRDILKYINYQHFDPVTMREIILAGYLGQIAGVQLVASAGNGIFEPVPRGTVYAVSDPQYLGGMPIRVPLQAEPTNKFMLGEAKKGWFLFEVISQIVLNPRGAAKAVKL
jgi:hypothetical protein